MKKIVLIVALYANLLQSHDIFIDSTTGLMWQNKASDSEEYDLDWENAKQYCNDLVLAGYDDWRLPDIKELISIIDTDDSPAIKKGFNRLYGEWCRFSYEYHGFN